MRNIFIMIVLFCSLRAEAALDCTVMIFANGKPTESKIELKQIKSKSEGTTYEADKDGYHFEAIIYHSNEVQKMVVEDKASHRRSVVSYDGMKPNGPDAFFRIAFIDDGPKSDTARAGTLKCQIKP